MVEAEPNMYAGYIVDHEDALCVHLQRWQVYGKADGVSDAWTMHMYRTCLPSNTTGGIFVDEFSSGEKELRRIARGEGLGDESRVGLFGSVDPHDLTQGSVGNCWLISAFAAAAEFPKSVKALCQQQKLSKDGRYDVRLFHPIKDAWEVVTIDDTSP